MLHFLSSHGFFGFLVPHAIQFQHLVPGTRIPWPAYTISSQGFNRATVCVPGKRALCFDVGLAISTFVQRADREPI